ncbi:MAG: MoxR family ATPase [Acidimicrobiaceae bacterium]|nr:MoxR family ATPase [Acidimicrobiaceae bacterium]MCY4294094.1 MoxR family ATPase [Acidimicrobiaceae bacterium]
MDLRAVSSVEDVSQGLRDNSYLPDEALATSVYLALRLRRPLLLEGEPGVGKTEVAKVIADWGGGRLIRLQCYEGIDVSQAVYEWDYARQLMHLRTMEATGKALGADEADLADQLYSERFLVRRPLLEAVASGDGATTVLLVDEVDRSDDEFEAFLLEVLSDYAITIPEIGTFKAPDPPVVVITSNRTRDVHDALKRRCLYHWVEHPGARREAQIIRLRAPEVAEALAREVAHAAAAIREVGLYKPPGVAETIDWARALNLLGGASLDLAGASATLGALLKYREDRDRVVQHDLAAIVSDAAAASETPSE